MQVQLLLRVPGSQTPGWGGDEGNVDPGAEQRRGGREVDGGKCSILFVYSAITRLCQENARRKAAPQLK